MKDKILFWLDANLIHYGIANSLQKQYDCELYAIISITDKPKKFFQEQKFVKFNKVWFYFDYILKSTKTPDVQYLASFEKKYNIKLWLLAYGERIFYRFNDFYEFSTDEILTILEQECKLFESVIDEIKPDFLIMKAADFHHPQLLYEICKAKGIKILLLGTPRFARRLIISSLPHRIDIPRNDDQSSGRNRTIEELQDFLKGSTYSGNIASYTTKFQNSKVKLLKAAYQLLSSKNDNIKTHYTYYGRTKLKVLIHSIIYSIKTRLNLNFINKNFVRTVDEQIPFLYYPLQIDEESTTLLTYPFYTNQIEVITHIVKSLPIGYKLYVKEHPVMFLRGWRNKNYYKQIMKLPNTVLVHHSVKSEEILQKCSLVITISSTSGLEAAFYKKPSIIFANTDYSHLSSVHKLENVEELPEAIRSSLQKKVNISDLNNHVNFTEENSFEFNFSELELSYHHHFYHEGYLVDVNITQSQMKSYLEKYKSQYDILVFEHLKKIKQYKHC